MKVNGGFVEPQRRAWILVQKGFGLGEELAGGGQKLAFLRGVLPVQREGGQAQSNDEECRQDGDGSAAAAPVAADARRKEVAGAGAELDAVGDQDPASAWPPVHRSPHRARSLVSGLGSVRCTGGLEACAGVGAGGGESVATPQSCRGVPVLGPSFGGLLDLAAGP